MLYKAKCVALKDTYDGLVLWFFFFNLKLLCIDPRDITTYIFPSIYLSWLGGLETNTNISQSTVYIEEINTYTCKVRYNLTI